MSQYTVQLKKEVDVSYPIEIGAHLMDTFVRDANLYLPDCKLAVITDEHVRPLYAEGLMDKLEKSGRRVSLFVMKPGEANKNRETKARIEDEMIAQGFGRDSSVVAIGGGTVTDLAGFLAGTYCRGIPYVNYATTFLAAADACVGGKTAVDTPTATNSIGLFYQPKKVYIDLATFSTLSNREMRCGLAETIKHGCLDQTQYRDLDGMTFFDYLEANMDQILAGDMTVMEKVAETNCKIKGKFVILDEGDTGIREGLNLGHTIGRALETVSDYRISHGEAVSIGLTAQMKLSVERGFMSEAQQSRVENLLKRGGLPVRIPVTIDQENLLQSLYTDKKVRNDTLRFVLQKGIGGLAEARDGSFGHEVTRQQAKEIIQSLREEN